MNILEGLLSKIRASRQVRMASSVEKFDQMIGELASGKEVDVDEFSELLDELDISHNDIAGLVEAKTNRLGRVANIKRLEPIANTLPKAEQDLEKIQKDIADFLAKKQPLLDAANERAKEARLASESLSAERNGLRTNHIPLRVRHRQTALLERQWALRAERQAYYDACGAEIERMDQLRRAERNSVELIAGHTMNDIRKADEREKLAETREEITKLQGVIDRYADKKRALDAHEDELRQESREIEKLLQLP